MPRKISVVPNLFLRKFPVRYKKYLEKQAKINKTSIRDYVVALVEKDKESKNAEKRK